MEPMDVFANLPALKLAVQVGLSAWMIAIAYLDYRSGIIPNVLTAPVIAIVGLYRLYEGFTGKPERFVLLVVWAIIFLLWMAHVVGGGDAKFLMALYALFPTMEFTAVLALILLLIMVPLVVLEFRRRSGGGGLGTLWRRLVTGQFLPTEKDLHERGRRYAWTYAVPGLVYLWLYW
jgi:Flp pilus assembly protein protease CpaA